jgi:fructokinase
MNNNSLIHVFGEVLFDYFPDGSRVLGGAPFNVAWHL